jgi:hypothetical protein
LLEYLLGARAFNLSHSTTLESSLRGWLPVFGSDIF